MQITVVDPETNITIVEDVERIQIFLESENRRAEVFFNKTLLSATGKKISKNWVSEPLILDLTNSKIVQALQLFREVIEGEEKARILAAQVEPLPPPLTLDPSVVSPSPAPTPTPTPPRKS